MKILFSLSLGPKVIQLSWERKIRSLMSFSFHQENLNIHPFFGLWRGSLSNLFINTKKQRKTSRLEAIKFVIFDIREWHIWAPPEIIHSTIPRWHTTYLCTIYLNTPPMTFPCYTISSTTTCNRSISGSKNTW